ncbi:trifunctional purine biosynthetic protein adenosine-3-like isoform X2 [Gouania willdenowi]|uniref:trifunctional purine biosynthetic protein adenosine-3-like isoform X2 n=1 Tax=Gouania willdenowi TaxID=441366 RepID=UPI00105669EE|nr:trifunctional purine biosynthetic protein adenosine-3-like isoform X2 [Gouania willdenowi]
MAAPALMDQTSSSSSSAEIVLVVSNRPGVQGLKRASLAGIQTRVVDHKLYGGRAEFDATIDRVQEEFKAELVCLAGFMRILTKCNVPGFLKVDAGIQPEDLCSSCSSVYWTSS